MDHSGWVQAFFSIAIVSTVVLPTSRAGAALGDNMTSSVVVDAEKTKLKVSTARVETSAAYSVHILQVQGLTTVREYVDSKGVVFAVTWQGMTRPNLETIFGSYYPEYASAESARVKTQGRSEVRLKTARLVVSRGGHMRALHGRGVVMSLVPAGVDAEKLP